MLTVERINKSFDTKLILKNVSLHVKRGTICGLIGKNGAGKTTLMNIILGFLVADSGNISISNNCKVGYLPDVPEYFDYLNCYEYLDFLARKKIEKSEILKILNLVHLDAKTSIKGMSRGMKQRLGIAASLINDPDILLLDEPASALDPEGRNELIEIMKSLKLSGKSILVSTHILSDMEKICDNVYFLNNGEIIKELKIEELNNNEVIEIIVDHELPILSEFQMHSTNDNFIYSVNRDYQKLLFTTLANSNTKIISIKNQKTTLDSIFMEICNE